MANVGTMSPVKGDIITTAHLKSLTRRSEEYFVVSGCDVTQQGTPAMGITVDAGVVIYGNTRVVVAGGNAAIGTADATYPRIDIVYVNAAGTIVVLAGAAAAIKPDAETNYKKFTTPYPAESVPAGVILALVHVGAGVTTILNANINDIAEYGLDYYNVNRLYNVSEARGCIATKGASTWQTLTAGLDGKYLRSNGATSDLTYDWLNLSSLYDAAQAQGDIITHNGSGWVRKGTGTAGQYIMAGGSGSDISYSYDPKSLSFGAGNGDAIILTGVVVGQYIRAQANYTIVGYWLAETSVTPISTTTVCDILKKSSYYPAASDSICASAKPTLTAATNVYSTTLTGWTTTISAGDILGFEVESNNAGKCLTCVLYLQRR